MQYEPQAGDTVMDEALALLEEAMELLTYEVTQVEEAEDFTKRARKFIRKENKAMGN